MCKQWLRKLFVALVLLLVYILVLSFRWTLSNFLQEAKNNSHTMLFTCVRKMSICMQNKTYSRPMISSLSLAYRTVLHIYLQYILIVANCFVHCWYCMYSSSEKPMRNMWVKYSDCDTAQFNYHHQMKLHNIKPLLEVTLITLTQKTW